MSVLGFSSLSSATEWRSPWLEGPRGVATAGVAPCVARWPPTVCSVAASRCPAASCEAGATCCTVRSCEPDASGVRGKSEGGQDRALHLKSLQAALDKARVWRRLTPQWWPLRSSGQVRGRVAERTAEVGRPLGGRSFNKSSSSGSRAHHVRRPGGRGESWS